MIAGPSWWNCSGRGYEVWPCWRQFITEGGVPLPVNKIKGPAFCLPAAQVPYSCRVLWSRTEALEFVLI